MKITELIKKHNFDYINPDITDEMFPEPKEIGKDYSLFHFNRYISSDDAVKEMEKEGYRPATAHELLLWEGWNGKDWVVALGSSAKVHGGQLVPVLSVDHVGRGLVLRSRDDDWSAYYRFLRVRNMSFETQTLGTPALGLSDSLTLEVAIELVKKNGYEIKRKGGIFKGKEILDMTREELLDFALWAVEKIVYREDEGLHQYSRQI